MYSVSGIALDNAGVGWRLMAPSRPLSELVKRAQSLTIPSRDGIVTLPASFESPVIAFVVRTPKAKLESLYSLFLQPAPYVAYTASAARSVAMEYMSAAVAGVTAGGAIVDVTFLMRLNGVFWRDTADTTALVAIGSSSVVVPVFSAMSAPVRNAVIRVMGSVTGLNVADTRGSFFSYPAALPAGSYLRFHSDTGRAFTTTTDVWTGGTEVTGLIVNGPGPYFLEITPTFTDPSVRAGALTVTTATQATSPTIEVRGKGAYLV
jgi:hypothetical protein